MATDISDKMRARANRDNLPADHPIRLAADAFDTAAKGYFAEPQTCAVKAFMGCWARARSRWSEYSGEAFL